MLERITAAQPMVVGFDILFAEPDRSSPPMPDYDISLHDFTLAQALHNSRIPVVLGYVFTGTELSPLREKHTPKTGSFPWGR